MTTFIASRFVYQPYILLPVGVCWNAVSLNSGYFFQNARLVFIVVNAHPQLLQIFGHRARHRYISTKNGLFTAMMENIHGQCRRHTYFPDSISKMASWIKFQFGILM